MSCDIFISHSSRDKVFADALVHALESCGWRCWYAPRDARTGGTKIDAVKEAAVMILVFSRHSSDSRKVARELELAWNHSRMVLPVKIDDFSPGQALLDKVSRHHWLDVDGLETGKAIRNVIDELKKIEPLRLIFQKHSYEQADMPMSQTPVPSQDLPVGHQKSSLTKTAKWSIALLSAFCVVAVGGQFWRTLEKKQAVEQLTENRQAVSVYTGPRGAEAKLVSQKSATPPYWLLQVVGSDDSRWSGRIFKCVTTRKFDETRYVTYDIDENQPYVLLSVEGDDALLFLPGHSAVSLTYDSERSGREKAQPLVTLHQQQDF